MSWHLVQYVFGRIRFSWKCVKSQLHSNVKYLAAKNNSAINTWFSSNMLPCHCKLKVSINEMKNTQINSLMLLIFYIGLRYQNNICRWFIDFNKINGLLTCSKLFAEKLKCLSYYLF